MRNRKKGFTLIEMLVVIAIIAILVAIVIPVVCETTSKARAAADAANLRSILGVLNTELAAGGKTISEAVISIQTPESMLNPGAELHVLYTNPGFIKVYYVSGTAYYGLDYLSQVAQGVDADTLSTAKPTTAGTWYQAGFPDPIG